MALSHFHLSSSLLHVTRGVAKKADTSLKTHVSECMLLLSSLLGQGNGDTFHTGSLPSAVLLGFSETC